MQHFSADLTIFKKLPLETPPLKNAHNQNSFLFSTAKNGPEQLNLEFSDWFVGQPID